MAARKDEQCVFVLELAYRACPKVHGYLFVRLEPKTRLSKGGLNES
nr:MAG TPA: hypothetical protein [Caudoviricetes sp.]